MTSAGHDREGRPVLWITGRHVPADRGSVFMFVFVSVYVPVPVCLRITVMHVPAYRGQ